MAESENDDLSSDDNPDKKSEEEEKMQIDDQLSDIEEV